jgi:hypothetical protein
MFGGSFQVLIIGSCQNDKVNQIQVELASGRIKI